MFLQMTAVLILGYLIGSISPAYILGRLLKGIDLREQGTENLGATNVLRILGLGPAIGVALFDLAKGLLAMEVPYLLNLPEIVIYICGFLAIVGHIFPFYLGFRGGKGAATATGLLIFSLAVLFLKNSFPFLDIIVFIIFALSIFWIVRDKTITIFFSSFFAFYLILFNFSLNPLLIFILALGLFIFLLNLKKIIAGKLLRLDKRIAKEIVAWRTIARPLAMVFPVAYFYLSKETTLWFVGLVAAFFLAIDLVRLLSSKVNIFFFVKIRKVFKKREKRRFSSITLFLTSSFLLIYFFEKSIAVYAITFLIFGDVFAKYFGLKFGRTKIFRKTLEGSLAHFVVCLCAGAILFKILPLPFLLIMVGALVATIFELIPLGINDNFAVSFSTAVSMFLLDKVI